MRLSILALGFTVVSCSHIPSRLTVRHAPPTLLTESTSTCRVCRQSFLPSENSHEACSFHPGRCIGAENAKHFGTHTGPGGVKPGLTVFWDCCSAPADSPGCCRQRHLTYDDACGAENAVSMEQAMRLRGGTFLSACRLNAGSAPSRRAPLPRCLALSDMEWRKRNSGDATARPVNKAREQEQEQDEECVPCAIAAQRGAEIEYALGLRDENSTGDRKELAVARLRKAVQGCASQAPTASQAEALLSVLGEAYIAGVDLDNQWMRAAAARVAEAEQR